jgi:hypothetical protein
MRHLHGSIVIQLRGPGSSRRLGPLMGSLQRKPSSDPLWYALRRALREMWSLLPKTAASRWWSSMTQTMPGTVDSN